MLPCLFPCGAPLGVNSLVSIRLRALVWSWSKHLNHCQASARNWSIGQNTENIYIFMYIHTYTYIYIYIYIHVFIKTGMYMSMYLIYDRYLILKMTCIDNNVFTLIKGYWIGPYRAIILPCLFPGGGPSWGE